MNDFEEQMLYNQQQMMLQQQEMMNKPRRYTKAEIYQAIQEYCYSQTGVMVTSMVKIDDTVDSLRHSCFYTGVVNLQKNNWQVPSEFGFINVPFYFCDKCGKLFVYNHIYD